MLQQPRRQHQHRAQCTRAVEAARTPRGRDRDFCNRWVVPVSSAPARPVCAMGALLKGPARPPFLPCLPVLASAMENRNRAGRLPRPDPGMISPLSSSLAGTAGTRLPVRCDPRMSSPARCVAGGDGPRSRQGALLDAPACQQRTRPPTNTRLRNTKNRLAHKSRAGQGPRTTRHISPSPFPPPYPRRGVYRIPAVSIERVRACMNVIRSRAERAQKTPAHCRCCSSPLSCLAAVCHRGTLRGFPFQHGQPLVLLRQYHRPPSASASTMLLLLPWHGWRPSRMVMPALLLLCCGASCPEAGAQADDGGRR